MKLALRAILASSAALALMVATASPASAADPPWLGVVIGDGGGGATVIEVITGSPAEGAGIRPGDVILRVDGKRTYSASSLISTVASLSIGKEVDIEFKRDDSMVVAPTTLTKRLTEHEMLSRRLLDKSFPPFNLNVLTGDGSGDSDDHKGDVVIFYVFESGCSNCSALNAALQELDADDGVQAIGISEAIGRSATAVTRVKGAPSGLTVLFDPAVDLRRTHFRVVGGPIVIVTDRKRQVRYAGLGDDIDIKELRFSVSRAQSDDSP